MIVEPTSPPSLKAIHSLERRSKHLRNKLLSHTAARKYYTRSYLVASNLRQQSSRILAGAGLTGALLISPVGINSDTPAKPVTEQSSLALTVSESLSRSLQSLTPHTPTNLSPEQSIQIEQAIYDSLGIKVKAELEGQRLNHQVGFVGYEQHLQRYPGDSAADHDEEQVAGIAPGLGAWGYFSSDRSHFTTTDYLREKYYSVAQTHLLPNWNQDFRHLREWYKYRKILLVNPVNGKAVVTVLGDAGPAEWTGKQFGASPEAMKALDLHAGSRKGLILFLFVDDPNNLVPLGPVTEPYLLNINNA